VIAVSLVMILAGIGVLLSSGGDLEESGFGRLGGVALIVVFGALAAGTAWLLRHTLRR
jgi:hypothetical protein